MSEYPILLASLTASVWILLSPQAVQQHTPVMLPELSTEPQTCRELTASELRRVGSLHYPNAAVIEVVEANFNDELLSVIVETELAPVVPGIAARSQLARDAVAIAPMLADSELCVD